MSNELIQAVKANTEITPVNWRETRTAMMTARNERHAKAAELEAQAAALRSDIKQAPNMQAVISHFASERDTALDAVFTALEDFVKSPDNAVKMVMCGAVFVLDGPAEQIVMRLGQDVVDVGIAALVTNRMPRSADLGRWCHSEESERVNAFEVCRRNGLATEALNTYEKARRELAEVQLFARSTF